MRYLIIALALVPALAVGDSSVGTTGSRDSDTRKERSLRDSQRIEIQRGKTNVDQSGTQNRTTRGDSSETSRGESRESATTSADKQTNEITYKFDATMEMPATALFFPLVSAIEHGEISLGPVPAQTLIKYCRLLTRSNPVPQVIFTAAGTRVLLNPHEAHGSRLTIKDQKYVHVAADANVANMARCYLAYGTMLARAQKALMQNAKAVNTDPKTGKRIIGVAGNIRELAADAFVTAISNPDLFAQLETQVHSATANGCRLPTSYAYIDGGTTDWSCGTFQVKPLEGSASWAGRSIFGQQGFMGGSVTFAQLASGGDTQLAEQGTETRDSRESGKRVSSTVGSSREAFTGSTASTSKGKTTSISKERAGATTDGQSTRTGSSTGVTATGTGQN